MTWACLINIKIRYPCGYLVAKRIWCINYSDNTRRHVNHLSSWFPLGRHQCRDSSSVGACSVRTWPPWLGRTFSEALAPPPPPPALCHSAHHPRTGLERCPIGSLPLHQARTGLSDSAVIFLGLIYVKLTGPGAMYWFDMGLSIATVTEQGQSCCWMLTDGKLSETVWLKMNSSLEMCLSACLITVAIYLILVGSTTLLLTITLHGFLLYIWLYFLLHNRMLSFMLTTIVNTK